MTGDSHLHLTQINGRKLGRELLLRIPEQRLWEALGNRWYEYPGDDCSSPNCQPSIGSKVQILRVSRSSFVPFRARRITSVSGNFEIELQDGKTFAGDFKAKFVALPKLDLCE